MTVEIKVQAKDTEEKKQVSESAADREDLRDFRMPESIDPALLDLLEDLKRRYLAYSDKKDTTKIENAFVFACKAHGGQTRKAGDLFVTHPIATAEMLTELEVDQDTLVAALLHDTVEDTDVSLELITELFGEDVALLVGGVTKLEQISYSSKEEVQAENFRNMFLAMAKDIRVVLIKLADRLHNMRTLKYQAPHKQIEIANQTKDIYAPLAHRLGIYKVKWELEDLCLRYLDRDSYYELVGSISQKRSEREEFMENVINELSSRIRGMGITSEIEGRPKHFYSIYNKMKQQGKTLDQIYDLFACRIIVETVSDCYAVLGLVHDLYKPMPGRFKDYIAMPKPNMYQSLHTTVIGNRGIPFEVQIRTVAMHRTAEYGIAAHWKYKDNMPSGGGASGKMTPLDMKLSWIRQLLDWQGESKDADEFLDTLKTGLVAEEVFVFTPKGDVISLPAHSIPIDFAYTIHSGIGNRMYGAKVNGRIVPLSYELQTGDIVDVLTSDKVHGPSRDWLKIVKSSAARSKIRNWFKKDMREENIARGKELFERDIKKTGFAAIQLTRQEILNPVLRKHSCAHLDDLLAMIGYGGVTSAKIVSRLKDEYLRSLSDEQRQDLGYRITSGGQLVYAPQVPVVTPDGNSPSGSKKRTSRSKDDSGVVVKGIENCLIHLSRCCSPVPGDKIIGYVTRGTGVGIHRTDCVNIRNILKNAGNSTRDTERASRLIDVYWRERGEQESYQVEISVLAHDRRHLLGDISNAIADEKGSIVSAQVNSMKDVTANLRMAVEVKDQSQFDRIVGRLKAIPDILDVKRGH